jgi:nucleoside-diphosphate-sugar epimerase
MTALVVTGAAGWLGLNIIDRLVRDEYAGPIAVLARTREEARAISEVAGDLALRIEIGDVGDESVLRRLLDDAAARSVIHAAGIIHPRAIGDLQKVNVEGTATMARCARDAGVARFVHISSNSPFGTNSGPNDYFRENEPYRPYLGYGESKMRAEIAVRESGIPAVILRPLWFYGPFQPERQATFFTMVRTGRFPIFGGGDNRRSLTYVPELAQAALAAAGGAAPDGSAWWIADSRSYSMLEIVEAVRVALELEGNRPKESTVRMPGLVSAVAQGADRLLQKAGRYNAQIHVLGELGQTIAADATAARAEFGLDPRSDLVRGMRDSIAWCRSRGIEI